MAKKGVRHRRNFSSGILNHCYQRTVDGMLLFYSVSDFLVFFTIISVISRRYKVKILAMCLMPDHVHTSTVAENKRQLTMFVHEYSRLFALLQNRLCKRSGHLFRTPFGSVPKYGPKKARTNLIYVWNNGVERQLCAKAEEYRWNFLAFAQNEHPFSEPIMMSNASANLKKAIAAVKSRYDSDNYLNYNLLKRISKHLGKKELDQLSDYIINLYNVIDYSAATEFFDSYDDLLMATHANTGGEYDLNEVFLGKSDAWYSKISAILMRELSLTDIHEVLSFPDDRKFEILKMLMAKTSAPPEQISAFLRLKVIKA